MARRCHGAQMIPPRPSDRAGLDAGRWRQYNLTALRRGDSAMSQDHSPPSGTRSDDPATTAGGIGRRVKRLGPARRPDFWLFVGVVLLAAAVRLPYLQQIPMFTDETATMAFAARLARGEPPGLVSNDTYIGPLHHLILAAGFRLGGDLTWPRELALILGSLTAGLTYLLGASLSAGARRRRGRWRERGPAEQPPALETNSADTAVGWPDRAAGLVGAILLAVSFVPVVVNSHVAWSNMATPFWIALMLIALSEAHRRDDPRRLLPSGVLAGLALQTHPSALVYLLGGAAYVAWMRPAWFRGRWPWLAALAAVLATGNLWAYNLRTGGQSLADAAGKDYAFSAWSGWGQYLANAREALRMAYQLVTSTFLGADPEQGNAALDPLLRAPGAILYGLVALIAILATARRQPLAALSWLVALAVLPFVHQGYRYYLHGRYMAPLLPATYATMGLFLVWIVARYPRRRPWWPGLAVLALLCVLVAHSLLGLRSFYARELAQDRTNARIWQVVTLLQEVSTEALPVRLDRGLRNVGTIGGGQIYRVLDELLKTANTPHKKPGVEELGNADPGTYLVLTPEQLAVPRQDLVLEPAAFPRPLAPLGTGEFGVYRVVGPR